MTAEVIVLPRIYWPPEPPSLMERVTSRVLAVRWGLARWLPIVVVRRSTLGERERNAFELGRDCERYMSR